MGVYIIETLVSLKPLIELLTAVGALGSLILLAVNALLIYRYVKATSKQAEATYKIMEFNRAEFAPNVQVLFNVDETEKNGASYKGLRLNNEGLLRIPVEFINLSKGVSEFSLVFLEFHTYISTVVGPIRFDVSLINKQVKNSPGIVKKREKLPYDIIFDLKKAFEKSGNDFNSLHILEAADFSVAYYIEYPDGREPFMEHWLIKLKGVIRINELEWVLKGDRFIMFREKYYGV